MPYYIEANIVGLDDITDLPIVLSSVPENPPAKDDSSDFYYFKGGDGGDLGKKSTFPRYVKNSIDVFPEENSELDLDSQGLYSLITASKYINPLVNYFPNSSTSVLGVYSSGSRYSINGYDNSKQTDAGYAIKYVTGLSRPTIGGGTIVDTLTSTITFEYQPVIPANLSGVNPRYLNTVADRDGVQADIVKRFVPTPSTGFAFHCEFDYDHATNLITIDQIQEPDGTIYSMAPQYNFTGMKLYLSGSGNAESFSRSLRIHHIDGSSLYGYADYATGSSVLSNYSGVIFLCGNEGTIFDGEVMMDPNNVGFIASDSYSGVDQDYFYYQLPSSGFVKMDIGTSDWENMLVVYMVDLDYDDKDRKLDPALITGEEIYDTGRYFYNYDGMSGLMDSNWEMYWNLRRGSVDVFTSSRDVIDGEAAGTAANITSETAHIANVGFGKGVNRCIFPFSILSSSDYDVSQMDNYLKNTFNNALEIEICRWNTGIYNWEYRDIEGPKIQPLGTTETDTNPVFEPRNTLCFRRDTFGLFQDTTGSYSEDYRADYAKNYDAAINKDFRTNRMQNVFYERGSFIQDYEFSKYSSTDRKRVQNRNKMSFLYHGYNKKTNTYFCGIDKSRNVATDFLNSNYYTDGYPVGRYIYVNNWCKFSTHPDAIHLSDYPDHAIYKQKAYGYNDMPSALKPTTYFYGDFAKENVVFDAVKMNIYNIYAYANIGDGSNQQISDLIEIAYENFKSQYKNRLVFGGAVSPSQYGENSYPTMVPMNTFHSEISDTGVYYDGFYNGNSLFYGKMQSVTEDY